MKICYSNKTLPFFISLMLLTQPVLAGEKKLDGASWVAQTDIVFAHRSSSMYVQAGKLVERARDGDRYVSYCEIVTKKKHDDPLTIKKGASFKISKTSYQTIAQDVVTSTFKTIMKVESADYPLVRSIDCSVWDDSSGSYLSVEKMHDTMKGVFILD